MTETVRSGDLRLDFAFGPGPRRPDAVDAFRLSDVRRTAQARGGARILARRAPEAKHVLWRRGVARLHDV